MGSADEAAAAAAAAAPKMRKRKKMGARARRRAPGSASGASLPTAEPGGESAAQARKRIRAGNKEASAPAPAPKEEEAEEELRARFGEARDAAAVDVSSAEARKARESRGPRKRQASNVRAVTTTDSSKMYCKDFKLTGYCGYGDSCVFAHIREDFEHGWQIDKRHEEERLARERLLRAGRGLADRPAGEGEEEEHLPWACHICKGDFDDPVVTRCGHYFCEGCAMTRYARNTACAACKKETAGIFNAAHKLRRALERRERA